MLTRWADKIRLTREQWAKIGITLQFLALVRTLVEYFRLKYVHGAQFSLVLAEPFIAGGLLAALFCWLAVTLFFFRRYSGALVVSAASVLLLLAYRFYALGWR